MAFISQIVLNQFDFARDTYDPLTMSLDSYNDPILLYRGNADNIYKAYADVVDPFGKEVISTNFTESILEEAGKNILEYRQRYIMAADFQKVPNLQLSYIVTF